MRNIKLTTKTQYTPDELKVINNIIAKENKKAKTVKPGKESSRLIKKITK